MGEMFVETVGLPLGAAFPTASYNKVHSLVVRRGRFGKRLATQWHASWNGVAFRYAALKTHDQAFRDSVSRSGTAPGGEERALQERELFGFFCNAAALFECFGYATYVVLAGCHVPTFTLRTFREQKRVDLPRLLPALRRQLPNDRLTNGIGRLMRSNTLAEIQDVRNYLAHRSAPPRRVFLGTAPDGRPAEWNLRIHGRRNIPVNASTTDDRMQWCSAMLSLVTGRLEAFSEARLPRRRP